MINNGMPGKMPFFIIGTVKSISHLIKTAYIKVPNGNIYHIFPFTLGIDFDRLKNNQNIEIEVTDELVKVYSARIIEDNRG